MRPIKSFFLSTVGAAAIMSATPSYAVMKTPVLTPDPVQANAAASALIKTRAIRMVQQIYSTTVNPANTPVVNVVPQAVGLVLGFLVEINATLAAPDAGYALTPWGPANAL